jgi:hypothetical protein
MKNSTAASPRYSHRLFALPLAILCAAFAPADGHGGMVFLQFADPAFRAGLVKHDMLGDAGHRLHNTGFRTESFGERWLGNGLLNEAEASGRPFYIDRITGGMPYQSLVGIGETADMLKGNSNFLGFQAHEWGNSPTHDYHRIHKLILEKGNEFNESTFAEFEGRTAHPYFSGGDFSIYKDLYVPMKTQEEVEQFLSAYFEKLVSITRGQIVSVTGHGQLHHTALRLGAKNVMAEIGNQVPLTAFQIACARGAARQHGKPFGAYYEPWGGAPTGCVCATSFSPWWPLEPAIKERMDGYNIGPQHGSSRSLQRRLLYYAWLSGASWWAEEWGAENYFSDWEDYPITRYGEIVREFQRSVTGFDQPKPIVPAAVVMPPDTFGIDIRYMAGYSNSLWRIAPGDQFHDKLRRFGKAFFATQSGGGGRDGQNLTPSPWIGCFDVFDAEVSAAQLSAYACVIYFEDGQNPGGDRDVLFDNSPEGNGRILNAIHGELPYSVGGRVGAAHARANGRYLLGVFNNLGIKKSTKGEVADPRAVEKVSLEGNMEDLEFLVGSEFTGHRENNALSLNIPAGELVVLSFPDP